MYTYVMFEVTPPDTSGEAVASVLRSNGWSVRDSTTAVLNAELHEDSNPMVDLILVEFDEFLDDDPLAPGREEFAEVPTLDNRTYYVAVLTPLRGLYPG